MNIINTRYQIRFINNNRKTSNITIIRRIEICHNVYLEISALNSKIKELSNDEINNISNQIENSFEFRKYKNCFMNLTNEQLTSLRNAGDRFQLISHGERTRYISQTCSNIFIKLSNVISTFRTHQHIFKDVYHRNIDGLICITLIPRRTMLRIITPPSIIENSDIQINEEETEPMCNICFENKPKNELVIYGNLQGEKLCQCNYRVCFECAQNQGNINPRCMICRQPFRSIIKNVFR